MKFYNLHSDGAHSGSASAVRNAKRLVQVQMGYVRSEIAGTAQGHLGVHVGAVHVDLTSTPMDDVANLGHFLFEHSVRRRIGDHQAGQSVFVLLRFGFQLGHVDAAGLVCVDRFDRHAGHLGRCRIRSVRRDRNQTHVPLFLANRVQVGFNGAQSGVLALSTALVKQIAGRE